MVRVIPTAKNDQKLKKTKKQLHEGLMETFPGSDLVSVTEPSTAPPDQKCRARHR